MFVGFGIQDFRRAVPGAGLRTSTRARPLRSPAFLSVGPKAAAFAILLRVFLRASGPSRALGAGRVGLRAGHHGGRQLRRDPAIEYQAHAGLQLHRARRIRAGGGRREFRNRLGRRDVLSGRLRVHQYRRVRGGDVRFPQGREIRRDRRFRRARPAPAGDGRDAHHFPAEPDRRAAHRRLLRQVLHLQSRARLATWCG